MNTIETKVCTRCGQVKSVELFGFARRRVDGSRSRHSWCKACIAEVARNRRATIEGREKARAASRKYHTSDKGKAWAQQHRQQPEVKANIATYMKEYCARLAVIEARRQYVQSPERKAARREYLHSERGKAVLAARLQHPEVKARLAANQRRYDSSEKGRAKQKAARARAHRLALHRITQQNRRCRKKNNGGAGVSQKDWLKVVAFFNERCAYCGESDNLTMDHVMPLVEGGHHSPENIVPACRRCNTVKHTNTDWEPRVFPACGDIARVG